jgi:hypothetical protein
MGRSARTRLVRRAAWRYVRLLPRLPPANVHALGAEGLANRAAQAGAARGRSPRHNRLSASLASSGRHSATPTQPTPSRHVMPTGRAGKGSESAVAAQTQAHLLLTDSLMPVAVDQGAALEPERISDAISRR